MTDRFEPRLSEYLDGELDAEEAFLVESHLEECAACREILEELERVRSAACALAPRTPPRDLWTGISRRIHEVESGSEALHLAEPGGDLATRRLPGVRLSWPQLAAAAVAVMALSSALAWQLAPGAAPAGPVRAGSPGDVSLVSDAASAQVADDRRMAIARMESALLSDDTELSPALREHVRRALQKIDLAITEAEQALATSPGDAFVKEHLDAKLDQKAEFLRRTTRLIGT